MNEPQKVTSDTKWALVGYGFGGRAIVAELGLAGIPVTVIDREPHRLSDLHRLGGLRVQGRANTLVEVTAATTNPAEALPDADVILVCTWSYDHDSVARTIAPHLRDDQLIVLVQGHFGGALEVRRVLTDVGASARVTIAEMDHFPFFGHLAEEGAAVVLDDPRSRVNIGSIPASEIDEVMKRVSRAFPMAHPAPSLLNTGFADTSALLHIPGLLFNVGLVEGPSEYRYYLDTMHPSVVSFVEKADAERKSLAEAFSVDVPSLETWYREVHGLDMPSLREMLHHMGSWTYRSAPAPKSFDCPYVNQDLAFTLVGWSTLAQAIGHPVPLIDAMIDIVGSFTGRDYRAEYGGLARLGVEPGTASEVRAAFEGERT